MGSQRKSYSGDFKTKVALEAVRGDRTISEIASEFGVHPSQVTAWRRRVLKELPEVLSKDRVRERQDDETLKARLFQEIGELKFELDWLKKKSRFAP